ncbi:class I adenylate-forming enzyme family protein [Roseovarius sp. C7]|uniref:class I adenylate-forming enzyme family protein n=1 Tax=Roseovarius sp. C7 TaxID=3398643 RepID=UPI0039F6A213
MLSVFDQGPPAPCPAPFNMAAYVLAQAAVTPDKLALAILGGEADERWSYAALEAAVRGTATGLLQAGLRPGDRVLMRLGNRVEFPIAYLGAIAVGLVPVPSSAALTAREVANMLPELAPAAILHAPDVACPDADCPMIDAAALAQMRHLPPAAYDMGDPERPAYIVYTSGTSGKPRGVIHAHRAIWARRMMHDGWYGIGPDDRLLHAGAFNWTYTLGTGLMDPWSLGATALIPAPGLDLAQLPQLMDSHGATIFAAAPGVYRKILNARAARPLPSLRHGLSAGEKLPASIEDSWRKATGTPIYEAYGMSECSTFISASPNRPAEPGTLGRPQHGRRIAILGPDGPAPLGHEGTIAIHQSDPGLMLGYLGAEAETRERFQGDWFLTGDQGVMSDSSSITYLARGDDMMNAGGYRVSPLEVEQALSDIPGLTEIAVTDIAVKSDARLIMAFYTGPEPLCETHLATLAAERLAGYKTPRGFFHVNALPHNPNGKLQRRALAQNLRGPA